jgi:hypothetical protein
LHLPLHRRREPGDPRRAVWRKLLGNMSGSALALATVLLTMPAAAVVTESVRGDGGVLRNSAGNRFMFDYIPDFFRKETAETEAEADRWYTDPDNNRRPPELLPRDEVARAIVERGTFRPVAHEDRPPPDARATSVSPLAGLR